MTKLPPLRSVKPIGEGPKTTYRILEERPVSFWNRKSWDHKVDLVDVTLDLPREETDRLIEQYKINARVQAGLEIEGTATQQGIDRGGGNPFDADAIAQTNAQIQQRRAGEEVTYTSSTPRRNLVDRMRSDKDLEEKEEKGQFPAQASVRLGDVTYTPKAEATPEPETPVDRANWMDSVVFEDDPPDKKEKLEQAQKKKTSA